jgi:hypothetical protein
MKLAAAICISILWASLSVESAIDDSHIPPIDVSYCQLVNDPLLFVGKNIRIRGIYRYFDEYKFLESPSCCTDPPLEIQVEMGSELSSHSERLFRKIDKGMGLGLVIFVGKFESMGSHIVFSKRFRLAVNEIEKIERTSKSSLLKDNPSWVPKNCEPSKSK